MAPHRSRWSAVLALFLTGALVLAGCGGSSGTHQAPAPSTTPSGTEPASKFGGELKIGVLADVGNFNPLVSNSINDNWILDLMYPTLITMNEEGQKVPYFATDWYYEDDGMKAVFKLRDDMQWDDGTPFTAADVKYTAEIVQRDMIGLCGSMLTDVASVETPDDYTVVFNMTKPYGPFLTTLGYWLKIVPKHQWESVEKPAEYPNNTDLIGAGPFKLVKYEKGQYYELHRVEHFPLAPEGKAYLDKIFFRVYPDMNTAILALKKGDIDAIANPVPAASVHDLEGTPGITLSKTPSLGYTHMTYNTQNPHLAKAEVRRALIHATNKEAIRQVVLLGNAIAIPTVVSPVLSEWYDDSIKDYEFDPDKAKELLTQAGYSDGNGDGFFDGLELSLIYDSGHANISKWVTMVADDAAKAGIKINLQGMERNTYLAKAQAREFDIYAGSWGVMDEPADYFALLFNPDGYINYGNVDDPELTALIDKARFTMDQDVVKEAVTAVQRYVADKAYVNTLYVETYNVAYNTDRFEGYTVYPSDLLSYLHPLSLSQVHRK